MTSCAVAGAAAIADRRAAAPNSANFVMGILLLTLGSNIPSPRAVYSNGDISSSPPTASMCFTAQDEIETCVLRPPTHVNQTHKQTARRIVGRRYWMLVKCDAFAGWPWRPGRLRY